MNDNKSFFLSHNVQTSKQSVVLTSSEQMVTLLFVTLMASAL